MTMRCRGGKHRNEQNRQPRRSKTDAALHGQAMEKKGMGLPVKRRSPYLSGSAKTRPRLAPEPQVPLLPSPSHSASGSGDGEGNVENGWDNCPAALPAELSWGQPRRVWELMVSKSRDPAYSRLSDIQIFNGRRHPDITQARIRAILLDWMLEVCEVYKLHRETFYISVDFVDRFLSRTEGFERNKLQLLGITALFSAAKLEEIYPPKCEEFAYVTDRACTEDEIRQFESYLIQKLEYRLTPVTPLHWLSTFLQLLYLGAGGEEKAEGVGSHAAVPASRGINAGLSDTPSCLLKPLFERESFLILVKVLDLAIMQEESLRWSGAVLAGAVVGSLLQSGGDPLREVATACRLNEASVREAASFLSPTIGVLESCPSSLPDDLRHESLAGCRLRQLDDIHADDLHNVQSRDATLKLYDFIAVQKAVARRALYSAPTPAPDLTPDFHLAPYPTPPGSTERPTTPPSCPLQPLNQ